MSGVGGDWNQHCLVRLQCQFPLSPKLLEVTNRILALAALSCTLLRLKNCSTAFECLAREATGKRIYEGACTLPDQDCLCRSSHHDCPREPRHLLDRCVDDIGCRQRGDCTGAAGHVIFFAGIYVRLDRPIRTGDYIKLESGEEGFVVQLGWRSTRIRTLPNNIVVVPNAKLASALR